MKILVIGGGGREHALSWRVAQSEDVEQVYCTPGNAGIAMEASCIPGNIVDPREMASLAETLGVSFTVVGPEAPLVAGVVDEFESRGLPVVGPSQAAAQLEGSKIFTKLFLNACNIPTAPFAVVESVSEIDAYIGRFGFPVALKADGLAAGKGVVIAHDESEAREQARKMLCGQLVGDAGRRLLVERFLHGHEVSFIILSDGERYFEYPAAQDHKAAFDNDEGPNTGGMGAYCDDGIVSDDLRGQIIETVVEPALAGMRRRGQIFRGFLYCGLMVGGEGPQVLEFNVRMGDPETQPLMYRLHGDFAGFLHSASRKSLDPTLVAVDRGPTACVVMASQGYPGNYRKGFAISGLREAEEMGVKVFHAGTRLSRGVPVTAGGRVLGVTARGTDLQSALDNTYAAVAKIHFEGARWRSDIGHKELELKHKRRRMSQSIERLTGPREKS